MWGSLLDRLWTAGDLALSVRPGAADGVWGGKATQSAPEQARADATSSSLDTRTRTARFGTFPDHRSLLLDTQGRRRHRHRHRRHRPSSRLRQLLPHDRPDRKSTRLNSSHLVISYAVFCVKKKPHVQVPAYR